MTEYIYRVVDRDGYADWDDEFLIEPDARSAAKTRNDRAARRGRDEHYRVQRAAVVWEDIDNG